MDIAVCYWDMEMEVVQFMSLSRQGMSILQSSRPMLPILRNGRRIS